MQVIGWGRYSLIEGVGGNGYEYHEFIDPNLGHNIDYRGEVSVMHLHTDITAGNKTTIGILGGSTSDISCFDTPSWPEQLIKVGEDQGKNLTLLCGGTGSYMVAQEVVKFLRDMSHQKMDILAAGGDYDVVFSVVEARRNPWFNMVREKGDGTVSLVIPSTYSARQQTPLVYDMNASLYAYRPDFLRSSKHLMQGRCGITVMEDTGVLDLDRENDFTLMEAVARYMLAEGKYAGWQEICAMASKIYNDNDMKIRDDEDASAFDCAG